MTASPNRRTPSDGPVHQCTAKSKSGNRQCRRSAIPGGTVCRYHGGAAPQVMRKARERLAEMVDPAIGELGALMRQNKHLPSKLGAVKDVLDRNNVGGKSISVKTEGADGLTFTLKIGDGGKDTPDDGDGDV